MKRIIKVKIGNHLWSIRFLDREQMRPGEDGTCWSCKKCIDIDSASGRNETSIILTHELVHALLATQGRCYQKKFSHEEMCEFVTWNIDEIIKIRDKVLKEVYK